MAKMALLIGVSEYEPGLNPLPGAAKDVESMQRVLQHPEVGGFDEVKTLSNPDPQQMQEAIEGLFSSRAKDDLVLLFFSGHGVKDDTGKLHLATRITRKTLQGDLIRATAVSARFVQDIMSNCRSKRQVVILDCCFSGAFAEGWLAKDDGSVDVKTQLGGEGRAVLTSSTSTQYSFEQEGSDLSTYTRYLVEGIETGAADFDNDGVVSIDELHDYAKGKVQEAAPAMKPEIYALKEGYKIHLSQAPTEDPKLRYRKEVDQCARRGEISAISRHTLDALRESLELSVNEAAAIEEEVLQPYQKYQKKLQRYEQVLVEALQHEPSLSSSTHKELKRLQRVLNLRDEDVAPIENKLLPQKPATPAATETDVISQPQPLLNRGAVAVAPSPAVIKSSNQANFPAIANANSSRVAASVASLSNPKLLIGAGIFTIGTLVSILLVNILPSQQVEPTASPTASANAPTTAEDFNARGDRKYNTGDYQGAIEDYNEAILLKPDYAEAYYDRGWAKKDAGDNQGAIADFNLAIQLEPNYVDAYLGRGHVKVNLNDYPGAFADYDQAIKLNPKYDYAYKSRGNAKAGSGDNQGAIADFDQAIKLNPDYADALNDRGWAKYNLGDNRGAIADFDQAIKLNSEFVFAFNNRALAKIGLGDNQGAIADCDQAIKLDSEYAHAYYNRGDAKEKLGDKQGAIEDFQKAVELYQQQGNIELHQDALDKIAKLQ